MRQQFLRPHPSFRVAAVLLGCFFCASFGTAQDFSQRKSAVEEILAIHQADRRAHFAGDPAALLEHIAPELLSVKDGKITRQTREDVRKQFAGYFRGSNYSAWDDLEQPQVRVSEDGRMAWMIVRVHSKFARLSDGGKEQQNEFVSAWTSTYEKAGGKWMMTTVTSTFEPN
jgi:ketosteroid isomerase-like protein